MTIFDRYIIRTFLKNYVLSFLVLISLYIALDMVFHFDVLARSGQDARGDASPLMPALRLLVNICDFYFYQSFAVFVQLSGIIPVVAAAFTLVRMTRFNELTAMLAAGVPLLRLAAPVLVAAVILSGLLIVDTEFVIPQITHKLMRSHDDVGKPGRSTYPIQAMEDGNGSLLVAARYTPPVSANGPAGMERVDIIEFGPDHRPSAHILAQSATFDPRRRVWLLKDGIRQTGLRPHDPITTTPVDAWETDIGPQEIALYRTNNFADFLATSQIDALLRHPRNYGMVPLLRVKQWRVVQPLANIILLLLAVPCVLTREPRTVKMAAAKTVLLTGAFVCAMFITHQLARKPPTAELSTYWPAMVLWAPLFVFGPLAVYLLDRVKT